MTRLTLTHLQLLFLFLFNCVQFSFEISCKDENNRNVDWFILYKLPKIDAELTGSDLKGGKGYAYLTSTSRPMKWKLSTISIESPSSMLGRTWTDYDNKRKVKPDIARMFYNDESPQEGGSTAVGHLKGIVAFDTQTGFWLIHSIPKFGEPLKYEYPKTALVNGQIAMCVTYNTPSLNEICNHLLYCNPNIYNSSITDRMLEILDKTAKTLFSDKPAFIRKPPFERQSILRSLRNQVFNTYAKDNQLETDIYSNILAPSLKTSLVSETWRRGAGINLAPSCEPQYSVTDITAVNMVVSNRLGDISFKSTEDHSKWAISLLPTRPWVCIGDLNRMASQARRGGGALCFESRTVWQAFRSIIADTAQCPS